MQHARHAPSAEKVDDHRPGIVELSFASGSQNRAADAPPAIRWSTAAWSDAAWSTSVSRFGLLYGTAYSSDHQIGRFVRARIQLVTASSFAVASSSGTSSAVVELEVLARTPPSMVTKSAPTLLASQ